MSVGIPGTGVGGLFYLISGLLMPIREVGRWAAGERDRASARLAARQAAIVAGVLAGLWVTGWLLGRLIARSRAVGSLLHMVDAGGPGANLLGLAAVLAAFLTLGLVLGGVEVVRLVVRSRDRERAQLRPRGAAGRQDGRMIQRRNVRALLARGIGVAGLLSLWPSVASPQQADDSRAVFLQAQQSASQAEALELYRRYVELEPSDPWGYMAVGDVLGQLGRLGDGLAWYDRARALAPGERDVAMGRAKLLARAGRSKAAAREYGRWLVVHPDDVEARRALERERRNSAPVVRPLAGGSRDSDGNAATFLGLRVNVLAADGARLGVGARRTTMQDGLNTSSTEEATFTAALRPGAAWNVDGALGVQRLVSSAIASELEPAPVATLRVRWQPSQGGGGPSVDLRGQHIVLASSPDLMAHRVRRSELGGRIDVPAGPVRLRGMGRAAAVQSDVDHNYRTVLGGGLAIPVAAGVELASLYHRMHYANPSVAGYFAPRLAEVVETGSYLEIERGRVLLAFDLGAGVQRVAQTGAAGPWRGAFRWYSLIGIILQPGRMLELEAEAYDTQLATQAQPTAAGWRYGAFSLSLRWAL